MADHEKNFQEFRLLKGRARATGVEIATLLKFRERMFRSHLISQYGKGSPLSELSEYLQAFYGIDVTPQHLRKILSRSDREAWDAAAESYYNLRQAKQQERLNSTQGA